MAADHRHSQIGYMFGQLCVVPDDPDELPGLADVDGDALAEGLAVAACATAKVPNPPPNARLTAITVLAIRPRADTRFLIASSPPCGDGWLITSKAQPDPRFLT